MAQTGAKRYFKNFSNEDFILHLSIYYFAFFR